MGDFWMTAVEWWVRSVVVGSALLLAGWVGARRLAGPAPRHQLAGWAVRVAVVAPLLCLFPAWLTVPAPKWGAAGTPAPEVGEKPAATEHRHEGPSEPRGNIPQDDRWWQPDSTVSFAAAPQAVTAGVLPDAPGGEPREAPATASGHVAWTAAGVIVPVALTLHAVAAAFLLLQLITGHVVLLRLRNLAAPAPDWVREVFGEVSRAAGVRSRVLVSDRIATPLCFGLARTTVLIPRGLADTASEAEVRWVFAHELDHLRRSDHRTGWWVGAARAMYFFVPWFWALRRELTLAQEYLADAAAAAADGRPVDYAAFLVDLSDQSDTGRTHRAPLLATGVMTGRSNLYRRVAMLLKFGAGVDRRVPRRWAMAVAGGLLSAAVALSGVGWAAEDERPKAVRVEKKVAPEPGGAPDVRPKDGDRPPRDGDRPGPRDSEGPPRVGPRDGDRPPPRPEVAELRRKIEEAVRKNDAAEAFRLIDELERAMMRSLPPRTGERPPARGGDRPRDGERPRNGDLPRGSYPLEEPRGAANDRLRESTDETLRGFERAMDQLKDNPEAREQIRRAMEEYRRSMDESRRQLEGAMRGLPRGGFPGGEGFPPLGGFGGGGLGGGGGFGARLGSPRFGVVTAPVPEPLAEQLDLPKDRGLIVANVLPGTPAEKAGLKRSDVLLTFAGKDVPANPGGFAELVSQVKAGEKVSVTVLRKGKKEEIKEVQLPEPERPRPPIGGGKFDPFGGGFGGFAPGRVAFERMEAVVKDGKFDIRASKGDTKYEVTGKVGDDGRRVVTGVAITEGGETAKADSLAMVPDKHRAAVNQLLGSVGGR